MQPVKALAESVRAARQPVSADNPLLAMERAASSWITTCLQTYGEFRDAMTETVFLNTYGSPWLQALVGLGVAGRASPGLSETSSGKQAPRDCVRSWSIGSNAGGPEEAALRALIYIRLPEGSIDERGFSVLKLIRASRPASKRLSLAQFKEIVREQYLLVCHDAERAINALPTLLGSDVTARKAALDVLHRVLAARDTLSGEGKRRLAQVEALFDVRREPSSKSEPAHA